MLALLLAPVLGPHPEVAVAAAPVRVAEPPAVVIPPRYLAQRLDWQRCDFDLYVRDLSPQAPQTRCATVVVPMDWRHPGAHPDITLAVALSRASGRSRGLLTLNPGGPGVAAIDAPALYAVDKPRLFTDFDLLGLDPRGFGQSTRAGCPVSTAELERLPVVLDHRIRRPATHRAEVAQAQLLARACGRGELNGFLGTEQSVADLEFLRSYLQANRRAGTPSYDKLHFVGFSYGAAVGAWYADAHPDHTGRFVLDSNPEWTASGYANQLRDPASFQRRRDQMFFPWVARRDRTYHLGESAAAVRRSYERIRTGVGRAYADDLSPVPAEALDEEVARRLLDDVSFPDAAGTLLDFASYAESDGDDTSARRLGGAGAPAARAQDDQQVLDASQVVRCQDSAYPRTVATLLRRADTDARRHPFLGYRNTVGVCSYWPGPATPRTLDLAGAPPLLMVQSEGDPLTAYEGALAAHRATGSRTRLVSVADNGQHGVYLSGVSPCAEKLADGYLFESRLPARDTTCTGRALPGESTVRPLDGPVRTPRAAAAAAPTLRTGGAAAGGRDARAVQLRRRVAAAELG